MIRATLRLARWELILIAVACLLIAGGSVALNLALGQAGQRQLACLATGADADCATEEVARLVGLLPSLQLAASAVAILSGAALGTLLVGTEIERASAPFAWSLVASRRKWLIERAAIYAAAVTVMLLPAAITVWALADSLPNGNGPLAFGLALGGPLLLGQGLVAFAVAGTVGTVTGRGLPSLVVSTIIAATVVAAAALLLDRQRDAALVDVGGRTDALVVSLSVIDSSGQAIPLEEAAREAARQRVPIETIYSVVEVGLPTSDLPRVSGIELAEYGAAAVVLLAPAIHFVRWRLPRA